MMGKLAINWMRTPLAPDAVLALIACRCMHVYKLPDCTCFSNGLKCTDLCKLQNCGNKKQEEESSVITYDSKSSNEDYQDELQCLMLVHSMCFCFYFLVNLF